MRMIMAVALLAVATAAHAGWERVADGGAGGGGVAAVYIDRGSIEREGDLRRVRQLYDMERTQPSGMRSWTSVEEYDCRTRRIRLVSTVAFSGPMAGGQPLGQLAVPLPWMDVSPGTSAAAILRMACG